jgi:hypothetical protein
MPVTDGTVSASDGAFDVSEGSVDPLERRVRAVLRESFGGTWLTHRYPGIRSDSDLYTFGYRFKPWTSAPIATAAEILSYMGEVIDENDLGPPSGASSRMRAVFRGEGPQARLEARTHQCRHMSKPPKERAPQIASFALHA